MNKFVEDWIYNSRRDEFLDLIGLIRAIRRY